MVFHLSLYYREIDGHHDKINNAENVPKLPKCFYNPHPFRNILDKRGHINKSLPNLKGDKLGLRHKAMDKVLSNQIIHSRCFESIFANLSQLNITIAAYSTFLMSRHVTSNENHARSKPLDSNREIIDLPAATSTGKTHLILYKSLSDSLQSLECYQPFNLLTIAPNDPVSRYRWIIGISLKFPVQLYKIKNKSVAFIWKINPNDSNSTVQNKSLEIILDIDRHIPIYHTRAMKQKAVELFTSHKKWSQDNITSLYNMITGGETDDLDESKKTINEKLASGMEINDIFDEEETEQLNRKGKFQNFWDSVDLLIKDYTTPHERRHGDASYISPLAPSLRALMDMAKLKMDEMFPQDKNNCIPSFEWFRRQFSPRNEFANTSKYFTGRFNAKRGLQQRLLRKFHPDQHYGAKQLCYFKQHASR